MTDGAENNHTERQAIMIEITGGGVLKEILHGAWWVMLLRGILAAILGLFAFFQPAGLILGLVQVMGFFFILDGILLIVGAIAGHMGRSRWLALLGGICYLLAGVAIFSSPLLSAIVTQTLIIYLMACFVLIAGIMRLATAIRLWKTGAHKWLLLVEGIVALGFAAVLISEPLVSAVLLMQVVGVIAVVMAISMIVLAFGLRKLAHAI